MIEDDGLANPSGYSCDSVRGEAFDSDDGLGFHACRGGDLVALVIGQWEDFEEGGAVDGGCGPGDLDIDSAASLLVGDTGDQIKDLRIENHHVLRSRKRGWKYLPPVKFSHDRFPL